jgi:hypothetical protein
LKSNITKKGKEVSENNNIQIGIINAEALLLTKEQIELNTKAKKNNAKADSKDYETIEFIGAGLLQAEAFQGNLSFEIDPSTIINNLDNPIKGLAIDFDEGKGFEDIGWKQQIISHQFSKTGDLSIKIKLTTKRGIYITTCPFKIHFLQRPIPSFTGTVSSTKIKGGRVAANVAGAEYAIFLGCDGILDKPIIVAEGYDPNNSVSINKLVADYRENLRVFLNNGYDLVFVNYDNGSDFIENNAQALKRVIQEINNKKVGHAEINKLSIIGLSMSGLIARWGLREMENAGQNHEVSRLICLDTPHKGANTSPGVSYVAADFANRGIASGLIEALLYNVSSYLSAIDSPAAKEQLLFQNASMAPNVYFSLFQNALSNLGNGGYPSQCKNIAFVNGALNGNQNRRPNGDLINPGDKIWDTNFEYWVCYGYIDCWTNVPNQNTEVYNEDAFGIPILCPIQFSTRSINLPYNLDRLAGGFNSSFNNFPGQQTLVTPRFAFVPTFSAVDYKGPLNTDADYTININNWLDGNSQVRADRQHLTPFRAIYGDDFNDQHPFIGNEGDAIRALAINEFGLNPFVAGCQGCSAGSGGLRGTYFNNIDLTPNGNTQTNVREMDYSSDENRHTVNGSFTLPNPPFEIITRENISARWEGSFEAPISGTYNLNVRTDDGVRVWVDGVGKVNDWGYYGPTNHPFQEFFFNAGERRNIRIDWFQGGGGYEAKFMWSFNGVQSIVPACRLFPTSIVISTDCNFTVSASAYQSSVGCGGTSLLSAGCSGTGCLGVSYNWNGNGNNYNGSPAAVTLPSSNGAVSYTLTGSKTGCSNQTASTLVTVSGCPGGTGTGGTTDLTEGGTASDDGANNPFNEGEAQAFDNSTNTKWLVFNPTGNIVYDFANQDAYAVNKYTVASANDDPARDPKNWNLQGSNDGTNWTTVDAQNNQIYGNRFEVKTYNFTNTTAYQQYRLNVTANNGSGLLQIAEIQLFGSAGTGGGGDPDRTENGTTSDDGANNPLNEGEAQTFDNTTSTKWLVFNSTGNIAYDFANQDAYAINKYTVASANDAPDRDPKNWNFQGSNDGVNWITVNSQVNQNYGSRFETKTFTFSNSTAYKLYRLNVTANNGSSLLQIAEIQMFGPAGNPSSRVANFEENSEVLLIYPNPTNGKVKVSFTLPKDENVWFNLYDTQGKNLQLNDFEGKSGRNIVEFDLQNYPSGAYFIDLQYNQKREVRKVMKVN